MRNWFLAAHISWVLIREKKAWQFNNFNHTWHKNSLHKLISHFYFYHSLGKFSKPRLMIFFLFFPENRLWNFLHIVSTELETICIKYQKVFQNSITFQTVQPVWNKVSVEGSVISTGTCQWNIQVKNLCKYFVSVLSLEGVFIPLALFTCWDSLIIKT